MQDNNTTQSTFMQLVHPLFSQAIRTKSNQEESSFPSALKALQSPLLILKFTLRNRSHKVKETAS